MVERIDIEQQTAYTASTLEEIDELTEIVFVEFGKHNAHIGHTAINVSEESAEFSHLVHFVHTLTREEVETIEVFFIVREKHFVARSFHRNHRFKDATLAFLNPLTHGVEVGGEVYSSREDAYAIFTLTFAIELLPPFVHEVEFGLIVHEDFDFLTSTIKCIANSSVLRSDVVLGAAFFFHISGTLHERVNVETSASDGEQTYGSEHRETSTHVVGDDE